MRMPIFMRMLHGYEGEYITSYLALSYLKTDQKIKSQNTWNDVKHIFFLYFFIDFYRYEFLCLNLLKRIVVLFVDFGGKVKQNTVATVRITLQENKVATRIREHMGSTERCFETPQVLQQKKNLSRHFSRFWQIIFFFIGKKFHFLK